MTTASRLPPHLVLRARQAWLVVLALWGVAILRTPDAWHFLDNLNLPIHETGHLVFAWGGEVLQFLGGTILQLAFPVAVAIAFHRRQDGVGTATGLWWFGQSQVNVARYVADARAQELPLVGGGEHDWTFLLATWDLLDADLAIARAIRLAALVTMMLAIWHGWRTLHPPVMAREGS